MPFAHCPSQQQDKLNCGAKVLVPKTDSREWVWENSYLATFDKNKVYISHFLFLSVKKNNTTFFEMHYFSKVKHEHIYILSCSMLFLSSVPQYKIVVPSMSNQGSQINKFGYDTTGLCYTESITLCVMINCNDDPFYHISIINTLHSYMFLLVWARPT